MELSYPLKLVVFTTLLRKIPKQNVNESVELRISVTPEIMNSLISLAKSGLYGKSHTDAAVRILEQEIVDHLQRAKDFKERRDLLTKS